MSVGVGDRPPTSRCPAPAGATYSLADFLGKPIVLVFYPGDDTPVCTKQLNSYNDGLDQFERLGAQVRRHLGAVGRQSRRVRRQARARLPAARRHRQGRRRRVRHARPARFPAAECVHHRPRRHDSVRPPSDRRPDVSAGQRADRRTREAALTHVGRGRSRIRRRPIRLCGRGSMSRERSPQAACGFCCGGVMPLGARSMVLPVQ